MIKGSRTRFCRKGHDKDLVGRDKGGHCKVCVKVIYKKSYKSHPLAKKQFCINGHDTFITGRDKHYECRECSRLETRERYKCLINGSIIVVRQQFCKNLHDTFLRGRTTIGICKECINESHRQKMKLNINYKLKFNLRNRLSQAILKNYKSGSAVRDLGCSIDFLKQYIVSQFKDGMTWDNWGSDWELDHIKELHAFDLTDRKQFLEAVHYTNLQPLIIEDHRIKTGQNRSR